MLKRRLAFLAIPLVLIACEAQEPERVATVDITPSPATVIAGQKLQLTATPKDAGGATLTGRTVTWSSNNTAVAVVSATGQVTGMLPGNATITATSEAVSSSTVVTVTPAPLVLINVTPSPLRVYVGRTAQLNVGLIDATGQVTVRPVTFTSSNNAVATVNASGVVSGVTPGTANITVTSEGRTVTVPVTVTLVPIATLTLTPTSGAVFVGNSLQFTVTLRDSAGVVLTGRTVIWSSSAPGVAAVTQSGLVTGLSQGTTTITASADGLFATARVTVTQQAVAVASVEIVPSTIQLNVGSVQVLTAIARDAQGNVLSNRPFVWASANTGIASVTQTGVITGVATGATTITATAEGRVGTATVSVGTITPTVSFLSARVGATDVAPGGTLTGTVVVTWRVTVPIGFNGRLETVLGGRAVCSNGIAGAQTVDIQCTIDTAALDADGNRLFPNGATVLSARLFDNNNAVVANSPNLTYTVTN